MSCYCCLGTLYHYLYPVGRGLGVDTVRYPFHLPDVALFRNPLPLFVSSWQRSWCGYGTVPFSLARRRLRRVFVLYGKLRCFKGSTLVQFLHSDLSSHPHFAGVTHISGLSHTQVPQISHIFCEPLRGQVPVVLHFLLLLTSPAAFISVINICVCTL